MLPFDPVAVLRDAHDRVVKYLRLSVTDRCNYRCLYCMPAEGVAYRARRELLTYEEMVRICGIFVAAGVSRIRLTGGEPLVRRELATSLVAKLAELPGVEDLSLTTNGHLLEELAPDLATAGLRRVNVSLDTLHPERFRELTRGGDVHRVRRGIEQAVRVGLAPVKINAVVLGGYNDADLADLVRYSSDVGAVLRLIEYMPIGVDDAWRPGRYVPIRRVREELSAEFDVAEAPAEVHGGGPAHYVNLAPRGGGRPVVVGFIAALSRNFCASCNRVRVTADGALRECLSREGSLSLRDLVRRGCSDEEIGDAIRQTLYGKVDGHYYAADRGHQHTLRAMSSIGG